MVLGSSVKEPCEIEKINSEGMRRSIVAKIDITKGTVIKESMLTFKRPANGLPPKYFSDVVGQQANRDLSIDTLLKWSDLDQCPKK